MYQQLLTLLTKKQTKVKNIAFCGWPSVRSHMGTYAYLRNVASDKNNFVFPDFLKIILLTYVRGTAFIRGSLGASGLRLRQLSIHGNIETRFWWLDVLPDINQFGLGKRCWNLATSSAVVEFCLYTCKFFKKFFFIQQDFYIVTPLILLVRIITKKFQKSKVR